MWKRGLRNYWSTVRSHWPSMWRRLRWLLPRAAAVLGAFFLLLLVMVGAAGWYTSRPEFCNSCHIMEPYYKSWAESSHKDVTCIECHFAPGFGGKLRGKLLGLVQLAKYVTKTQGPRPAAEVPDASCLRSGCHESRLLSGRVMYENVHFDHAPHMGGERHGIQLRCTSCHSQIVQGKHMAVTKSTCFLCHFKNQPFNEDLSACTHCHQIPVKEYDLGGGVKFTHELAYRKGIDCISCHQDLIRGTGEVPRERCLVCHNREGDLARIKDFKFMHAKHVSEHAVDCLDCHLRIEHSFDKQRMLHAAGDCGSCHPNHHQQQVHMFEGAQGTEVPAHAGGMMAARVNCRFCHRFEEQSPSGTVLWKASSQVCAICHEPATAQRLWSDHEALRAGLPEIGSALDAVRRALPGAKLADARRLAIAKQLDRLQADFDFLRRGNDIHNIQYGSKLEQALVEQVSKLCGELKIAAPKVRLPAVEPLRP